MFEELLEIVDCPLVDLVFLDLLEATHERSSDSVEGCLTVIHEKILQEEECGETSAAVVEKSDCWHGYVFQGKILVIQNVHFFYLVHHSQDLPHSINMSGFDGLDLITVVQKLLSIHSLPCFFVDGLFLFRLFFFGRGLCLCCWTSFASFCTALSSCSAFFGLWLGSHLLHHGSLKLCWCHCFGWLLLFYFFFFWSFSYLLFSF